MNTALSYKTAKIPCGEKMRRRAWIVVVIVGGVLAALVYAQLSRPSAEAFARNPNGQAFFETFQAIQDDYLNKLDPNQLNKVIEGGIQGMVGALNNQFSSYVSPEEAKSDEEFRRGEFFGIGATLGPGEGGKGATILQLIRGKPAFNAGIQVGDNIVEVNGEDVSQLNSGQIRNKIVGPDGTKVTVGVKRAGSNVTLRFDMIRQRIEVTTVTKGMLPGNIGYVSLETFQTDKGNDQLTAAIRDLKAQGAQKLILDLRDNGGGQLQQACLVASDFLKEGPIVFQRTRQRTQLVCEADGKVAWSGPLVVLVNRNSASASEIVSGAIQDDKRGKIIGEQTFGKGVGQYVRPLSNGGELILVTFEWLTPLKRGIQKKGITPDVVVQDNRFQTPLSFEGTGAKPGDTVTMSIGGQTFTAKANDQGKFTFSQPRSTPVVAAQPGQAVLDLEKDAILKRAVEELK